MATSGIIFSSVSWLLIQLLFKSGLMSSFHSNTTVTVIIANCPEGTSFLDYLGIDLTTTIDGSKFLWNSGMKWIAIERLHFFYTLLSLSLSLFSLVHHHHHLPIVFLSCLVSHSFCSLQWFFFPPQVPCSPSGKFSTVNPITITLSDKKNIITEPYPEIPESWDFHFLLLFPTISSTYNL